MSNEGSPSFWDTLRHAFAIPREADTPFSDEDRLLLARVAEGVRAREMTVPAVLLLEMCRPLQGVATQLTIFFSPLLETMGLGSQNERLLQLLQRPGVIDHMLRQLESQSPVEPLPDTKTP